MSMPPHRKFAGAALFAAFGCAALQAGAQQNAPLVLFEVVNDARLPSDTAWRVTAGAQVARNTWCMSRYLKCVAFAGAEGRQPGTELVATSPVFRNDDGDKPRNLVTDLVSGMRFSVADTRGEVHGPLYVEFKVARRGPEIRSSVPIPRRTMATMSLGIDF
jgi:hypothetical protein